MFEDARNLQTTKYKFFRYNNSKGYHRIYVTQFMCNYKKITNNMSKSYTLASKAQKSNPTSYILPCWIQIVDTLRDQAPLTVRWEEDCLPVWKVWLDLAPGRAKDLLDTAPSLYPKVRDPCSHSECLLILIICALKPKHPC